MPFKSSLYCQAVRNSYLIYSTCKSSSSFNSVKPSLGTEYDFGDAEAITDAGIYWDEWGGTDSNFDTVGTAETDLDTSYYNAITASLMTNTSIAGYAGISNVKSRLFFKVADRVMKDDGSFLAESGRVQEIIAYKRDLSASEILRVQNHCLS